MMGRGAVINDLPNEVLNEAFSSFPLSALVSAAKVSRRFNVLAHEHIHSFVQDVFGQPSHTVILEAYSPSGKQSALRVPCIHVSTAASPFPSTSSSPQTEAYLPTSTIYSCFKPLPVQPKECRGSVRGFGHNGTIGTNSGACVSHIPARKDENLEQPAVLLTLEQHERFVHLFTTASVVRLSPQPGMYVSCAIVGDDVTRISRDWLAERAAADVRSGKRLDSAEEDRDDETRDEEADVLWLNGKTNVGLRVRAVERADLAPPKHVPAKEDEDKEVVYSVEFVEVVARTVPLIEKIIEADTCEVWAVGKVAGDLVMGPPFKHRLG